MTQRLSFHRPPLPLLLLILFSCALLPAVTLADSDIVASLSELATGKDECSQKADIFFAVDSSHSVGRANFGLVRNFIAEIVSRLLAKSNKFQFGVVIFSDKADMVVKLKDYAMDKANERKALIKFLRQDLSYKSGKTATGEAFQLIRELGFLPENGHRRDARSIVVLLTDGRANGRVNAVTESARLRGSGVGASVLAIGIGSGVSRGSLQLLAGEAKRVTLVNGFDDLGKVSRLVTSVLCGSSDSGAAVAAGVSVKTCGVGLKLIAGVCVPVKPKCRRVCPKGFLLVHPCNCTPDVAVGSGCVKSCRESEILVRGCVCVPRHVPSKAAKPKVCKKACPEGKKLNAAKCKCECESKCPGPNFSQAAEDCSCACSMRCRPGLALNKKTCECQMVDCPPHFEYFDGRCRHIVKRLCPAGQILFRDVCKRGHSCPKGYELHRDRKCYKVGCEPGYKKAKDGSCKKMCSGKRYYYNRRCHEPMTCGKRKYFRVSASGCPRTCAEPVRLTRCPKERQPACVCQPYYLLLNGKCVHPSDCPNVPICIEKADVIFMLDSSLTVTEHNFYMMKNFVRDVVQQFYLRTGTRQRVGVMRFNHRADIIMDLDSWQRHSHEDIQKQIEALEYQPGLTFLGEALHTVRTRMWRKRAGMREDVPRVTILLTDGTDTNGQVDQYYEAEKLRELGVFFVTIAMGDQIGVGENRRSLEKLAGPEGRVFIFGLHDFQDIHGLVSRVLSFHCERPLCPHPYLIYGDCIGDYKSISRVEYISEKFRCKKTVRHDFKRIRCACPKPDVKEGPCVKMFRTVARGVYTLDKKAGICKAKFKDSKARCACPADKVVESRCLNYKRTVTTTAFTLVRAGSEPESAKCIPKTTTKTLRCASGYITLKYKLIDEPPVLKKLIKENVETVINLMAESLADALKLKKYQVADMKLNADLHGSCKVPYKAAHPFAVLVKSDTFNFLWKKSKFKFNPKSVKVILPECPKPIRKEGPCLHNFKLIYETLYKFEHKSLSCVKITRTKELRCSCPKPVVETAHCNGKFVPIKVYEQRVNKHNGCNDILWTGSAKCARSCSKRTDVAFVIDSSDSVRGANFEYIRRFIVAVAKRLDVSRDNTHIAVLKYSSVEQMKVVFNFVAHYNFKSMAQRVMEMRYSPGSTYTGDALRNFRRFLLNSINGYRGGSSSGVESVVVLVTDGASNSAIDPVKEASKIKALGCSIVTIGVGDDVQSKELAKVASEPAAIHSFKADSFRDLVDSTFVESVVTATCRVGKVNKVAVKQQWTNKIRDLMARKIELNFADLGLTKFDPKDLARFEFRLEGTYSAIVGSTQMAKSTFLSRVRDVLAEALSLHPFSIRKLQVTNKLILSGQISAAKLDRLKSLIKADKLKLGWRGSALKIDKSSFAVLSPACPKPQRLEDECLHNFKLVHEILYEFEHKSLSCVKITRTKELRCSCPKPVVETAHCNGKFVPIKVYEQRVNKHNGCNDILWTGSAKCARSCSKRTDVAFVIDSSDSVRGTNFEYIRRFIIAVAKRLDVSRDNTHIAVLKYSSVEQMKVVFNFVAHYNFKSMAQRVMEMRYSPGSTYTGDALRNFRRFLLNSINGYRGGSSSGVESVVVLVTDGASNSAIDPVKEASKIKALGCSIVTIGVGDDVQSKELAKVASEPAAIHSFKADSFRDLVDSTFVESVVTATCRVGKVNKVSVLEQYTQILRTAQAKNFDVDWKKFGFTRLEYSQLAAVSFKLIQVPDAPTVSIATMRHREALGSAMRSALTGALRLHPFAAARLRLRPPSGLSGSVRLPAEKTDSLKRLVRSGQFQFDWSGATFKIDPKSLSIVSPEATDAIRQAQLAPDLALDAWRPLRRLVRRAEESAPRIRRDDARRLAFDELRRLNKLLASSERRLDRLATDCSAAVAAASDGSSRSRLQRLLRSCADSTQRLLTDAAKVVRRVGYVRYFVQAGDWANMRHGERRVSRRVTRARDRLPALLPLANQPVPTPPPPPTGPSLAELRRRALVSLTLGVRELRRLHRALFAAHRLTFTGLQPALTRARGEQLDRLDNRLRRFAAVRNAVSKAYSKLAMPPDASGAVLSEDSTSKPIEDYLATLIRAADEADQLPAQARSVAAVHPAAADGLARLAPGLASAAESLREAAARIGKNVRQFRKMPKH